MQIPTKGVGRRTSWSKHFDYCVAIDIRNKKRDKLLDIMASQLNCLCFLPQNNLSKKKLS